MLGVVVLIVKAQHRMWRRDCHQSRETSSIRLLRAHHTCNVFLDLLNSSQRAIPQTAPKHVVTWVRSKEAGRTDGPIFQPFCRSDYRHLKVVDLSIRSVSMTTRDCNMKKHGFKREGSSHLQYNFTGVCMQTAIWRIP